MILFAIQPHAGVLIVSNNPLSHTRGRIDLAFEDDFFVSLAKEKDFLVIAHALADEYNGISSAPVVHACLICQETMISQILEEQIDTQIGT